MPYSVESYSYPDEGIVFTPEGLDGCENLDELRFSTPEDPKLGEAIANNLMSVDSGIFIPQVHLGAPDLAEAVLGTHDLCRGTVLQGSPRIGIHPSANHYDPKTHTLELSLEEAATVLHETNHAKHCIAHNGEYRHPVLREVLGVAEMDVMRGLFSGDPVMMKAAEMEAFFLSIVDARECGMSPEAVRMIFKMNLVNLSNYDSSVCVEDCPSENWLSEEEFLQMRPDENVRTTLDRNLRKAQEEEQAVGSINANFIVENKLYSSGNDELTDKDFDFLDD